MKQNQIIAIVSGKKARATKTITEIHHGWKDSELTGIVRTYEPKDEEGERFPSESREVQIRAARIIPKVTEILRDFYDFVLTQEYANQLAKADVKIDDKTLLVGLPVTTILFLEKQVVDLLAFAKNLPALPTDKVWKYDSGKDCFVSDIEETNKTKKVPKVITKCAATKEHPAQTELITIDETIGHWKTIHLSGAVTVEYKEKIIKRLEVLQDVLKMAREEANSQEVSMLKMGDSIFSYIFAD